MKDDREEFEQDQVHRDNEADLDQEAWALQEQPGTLTIRNETDEPVEYRVVPLEQPTEPLFGERLRAAARRNGLMAVDEIADAIDQDAAELNIRANVAQSALARVLREKEHLRRQVEDAVERLRYTVGTYANTKKDVLDAGTFHAELDRIFGERTEAEPTSSLVVAPVERRHRPGCRALQGGWMCDCGHPTEAEWLSSERDRRVSAEHEPAAERRERHAAKFEDREGRVEGVDR